MDMDDDTVLKDGRLVKQGGRIKTWKHRYFVLTPMALKYYDAPDGHIRNLDKKLKGMIFLADAKVSRIPISQINRKNCFQIATPKRSYVIQAPSEEETEDWVRLISRVIAGEAAEVYALKTGSNKRTMKLDYEPVEHLILVLEGAAVQNESLRRLNDCVMSCADDLEYVLKTHFPNASGSVDFQLIEWQGKIPNLAASTHNLDALRQHSEQDGTLGQLSQLTGDTFLDVMVYTSPRYRQSIIDVVTHLMNKRVEVYIKTHPRFTGKVSLAAHGLGGIIAFDILWHQNNSIDKFGFIDYPALTFNLENCFCIGSALGAYLKIQGRDLGQVMAVPKCHQLFNVFHPHDAAAYRVEPLLNNNRYARMKPLELPSVDNISRAPSGSRDGGSAGARGSVGAGGGNNRSSVRSPGSRGSKRGSSSGKKLFSGAQQPDAKMSFLQSLGRSMKGSPLHRYDYVLAAPSQVSAETALRVRQLYWDSKDVVMFMLCMAFGGDSVLSRYLDIDS